MNAPDHKKCNSSHHVGERWLPLTKEYWYTAGFLKNGERKWDHQCKECAKRDSRIKYRKNGKHTWKHKNAYIRARSRALTKLSKLVPELYERCLVEELNKEGVPHNLKYDERNYKSITVNYKGDKSIST